MKKQKNESIHKCYFIFLSLFVISLFCSGCANLLLENNIRPDTFASKEIGVASSILSSKYCGQEIIDNKAFHHYIITNNKPCRNDSAIDLLLPVSTQDNLKAILRESSIEQKCLDMPATVYFMYIPKLNDPNYLSKYPTNLFIFPPGQFGKNEIKISYKVDIDGQKSKFVQVVADDTNLKWMCRSKVKYVAYGVLYPFAWVYDAIATPILIVLVAFTYHGP
jgi:hypothetical protein